jgi:uncharacterized membrane protein
VALRSRLILAAFWLTMGVLHFVGYEATLAQMPAYWPWKGFFVYASGVAEIVAAIALAPPKTVRWGALGTMLLLVAYTPAVIHIVLDAHMSTAFRVIVVPANIGLYLWARAVRAAPT